MYPKLIDIGPVPIYSYGLMLGIAFLVGSVVLRRELVRKHLDENLAITLTFIALVAGVAGSKLFYIIEEWNFGDIPLSSLLKTDVLFSPSGLTFYGGLILSIIAMIIFCKVKKLSVLEILDCLAPAAALGYGMARIGCHLSGDGDYGIPVNGTMWEFIGYSYVNGTVPTPPGVLVHPTSIYEFLIGIGIFLYLWNYRTKSQFNGDVFFRYLILSGIARLFIEIIRLNPKVIFDLSQAQLISILLIVFGGVMWIIKSREKTTPAST